MRILSHLKKFLAFSLAIGHFTTSLALAESKSENFRAPAGVQVTESVPSKSYVISYGDNKIKLDFIDGEDEKVLIDGEAYAFSLNDDRQKLEEDLKNWLELRHRPNLQSNLLEFWIELLTPKAFAFNWLVAGLAAVAIIGVIIAVKAQKRTRDARAETRDNRARIHNNVHLRDHNLRHLDFLRQANENSSGSSSSVASSSSSATSSSSSEGWTNVNSFEIRDESH